MSMAMVNPSSPRPEKSGGGLFWALVPVGLLTASVVGVGTMATIASRDPGFAIEQGYYDRAVHWDQQQAEWAENARLGYQLAFSVAEAEGRREVVAVVKDRNGSLIRGATVHVEAFANARAGDRRKLVLSERADGSYRAPLERARSGLWEFRSEVRNDHFRFTDVSRVDLEPLGKR
jgi:hypothetical protein